MEIINMIPITEKDIFQDLIIEEIEKVTNLLNKYISNEIEPKRHGELFTIIAMLRIELQKIEKETEIGKKIGRKYPNPLC